MIPGTVYVTLFPYLFISYGIVHFIGSSQLVPEVPTSTDFSILYHCDMILDYAEVALHFRSYLCQFFACDERCHSKLPHKIIQIDMRVAPGARVKGTTRESWRP